MARHLKEKSLLEAERGEAAILPVGEQLSFFGVVKIGYQHFRLQKRITG